MPDAQKKEPGHPVVEQPERGDPRLHEQPADKGKDAGITGPTTNDRPPAKRDPQSPWMGGG